MFCALSHFGADARLGLSMNSAVGQVPVCPPKHASYGFGGVTLAVSMGGKDPTRFGFAGKGRVGLAVIVGKSNLSEEGPVLFRNHRPVAKTELTPMSGIAKEP